MFHKAMMVVIAIVLLTSGVGQAKGPKDEKDYDRKKGYSGIGVPPASRESLITPGKSQLPTQPNPGKVSPYPARPTRPLGGPIPHPDNKYSKQRPGYPTQRPTTNPGTGSPTQRPSPVQFPSRPTFYAKGQPHENESARPERGKPTRPTYGKPPLVFYPDSNKTKEPRPSERPTTLPNVPTRRPDFGSRDPRDRFPGSRDPRDRDPGNRQPPYYGGLRPDYRGQGGPSNYPSRPTVVNRPTIINNQTTNVTRNTTNINQWFNSNTWQDRPTINSRNWNDRPWWNTADYQDWHHGHWHGNYYFRGRNAWNHVDTNDHQWLNGLASWGLGNLMYRSGYQQYANPFYDRPLTLGTTIIDYSRPLCVLQSPYSEAVINDQAKANLLRERAEGYFADARRFFYSRNPPAALERINQAIALLPDDSAMHEFRALVLFAMKRYREAAEVVYALLAVAPGWDWTTMSGLYPDDDVYADQLRDLEKYVRIKPREADARFLLAYHYITAGYPDAAAQQLEAVLALNPDDRLSADLLDLLRGEAVQQPAPPLPGGGIVRAADLEGQWRARRSDGVIELRIGGDRFAWNYHLPNYEQALRGKYTVMQNHLLLATEDGSQMVGEVTLRDRNHFRFQLLGSGANNTGVEFERQ